MKPTQLVDLFQRARGDRSLAIIEGVQALKHAVRFGAKISNITTLNKNQLELFLQELAPDVKQQILEATTEVLEETFTRLSPQPPRTGVIAVARRRDYQLSDISESKPIVFLEDPRDLENIGAVIRVAAAADAGGVVISGQADIWHPAVIRGAAGLHYAIPILKGLIDTIAAKRKIVSLDPTGSDIKESIVEQNSVLVFGTERYGISQALLEKSNQIVRLPMKQGVSSLNLATSVSATLYMM